MENVCSYRKGRAKVKKAQYLSTENILQNYAGIEPYDDLTETEGISIQSGDTLMANIRPYLRKVWQSEFDGACSTDVLAFSPDNIDGNFLYFLIAQDRFVNYVMCGAKGSKMPRGDKNHILEYETGVPTESEQRKIAHFIDLLNARISSQNSLINLFKKYKRGLLQQIFNTNLKYCNSNKCKEKSICDVFSITRGYVLPISKISPVKTSEFCYPVYSSQTIDDGLLGYYNEYLFENAITWTTDGANAGYTRFRKGKFYCTNVCGVLLNNNGFANEYVAEKINSVSRKYVSYVGNPKLMNNVMAEITIPFPDVETQKYYSEIIDKINMKLSISYNQCKTLELLKRCLLQQMFI